MSIMKGLRSKFKNLNIVFASVLLTLVVIASATWFAFSYMSLNRSIQNERVDSMEQIANIILNEVQLITDRYVAELENVSALLANEQVDTFAKAESLLVGETNLCLLRADGSACDLKLNPIYFDDIGSIYASLNNGEIDSLFGSVKTKGDYWIFTNPVDDIVLDGVEIDAVIKLLDVDIYADITTTMIFGNQGASYVVDPNGVIIFRPDGVSENTFFQSYNMLKKMETENVAEEQIETLRSALYNKTDSQIVIEMGGTTWLIQTIPDQDDRNIVMTVPISITARDTFTNMRYSILSMLLAIISLSALFIMWMLYFYHKDGKLKLEQAKAYSKSNFMNKVSHDIRTPLNAIVGMLEIAERSIKDTKQVENCLYSAKKSSEYLISIINDVLDMSRIENGKLKISNDRFNLKKLLETIIEIETMPAKSKDIELTLEDNCNFSVQHIGDEVRIKQCLINLISNSIKFTNNGGRVTLGCNEISLEGDKSLVRFTVSDTGIGMSKEFMKSMFEPFEQENSLGSEATGSGLGLSIVYNLTNLMGGKVHAESEIGVGTTFVVELPLDTVPVGREIDEQVDNLDEGILKGKRVLLAEDNEINRSIARFLLEDLDMVVEEAENGKIALMKFTESKPGYYDLILMDIQMPIMNGLVSSKEIRSSAHPDSKTIPIVALSANAFKEDADKSIEAGMQAHLSKPINPDLLKEVLHKFIKDNLNKGDSHED